MTQSHAEVARAGFIADLLGEQFAAEIPNLYAGSIITPVGERLIAIALPSSFPYRPPAVIPIDLQYQEWGRHQMARENGALCLWEASGERAWDPATTAADVLARAAAWFEKNDTDSWTPEERPPDLQYSFPAKRHLMVTGDDWPFAAGSFGRFAVWESPLLSLAAKPVARYDAIEQLKSEDALPVLLKESVVKRRPIGIWFRLETEPKPRPKLGPMLEEVAKCWNERTDPRDILRGALGEKVHAETVVVMALGYPDPVSGEERWLFIDARTSSGKSADLIEADLRSYSHAPADRAALMRRSGAQAVTLESKRVVIFGVGALGSPLVVTLARAGVGTFDLYDHDTLRPGNVIRHAARMTYVAFSKTFATAAAMRDRAPYVRVEEHDEVWDPATIDAAISAADLVIDATATTGLTLLLAERCSGKEKPLLWVTAQRAAQVGRVRVFQAGLDACPQCYRPCEDSALEPAVPRLDYEETFRESGCGAPTSTASPADLEHIAVSAAQLSLRVLNGRTEGINEVWVVNEPILGGDAPLDARGVHERSRPPVASCVLCRRR